jgi:hypothetical protein
MNLAPCCCLVPVLVLLPVRLPSPPAHARKRGLGKMPRPSLPGPIGPDYTKPGRALPSQPRTPDRSRGALNTEAVTKSVTDLTPKRSRWRVTGFWHQPRLKRARRFFHSARCFSLVLSTYVSAIPYSLNCLAAELEKPLTSTPERQGTIKWPVRRKHRPINSREVACVTVNRPINSREVACVTVNRPINSREVACVGVNRSIKPMHREVGCVRKGPIVDPRTPRRIRVTIVWAMVHGVTVSAAATVMNNRHITEGAARRSRRSRQCKTRAYDRHRCILLSVPHLHISCGNLSALELSACCSNAEMA